MRRSAAPSQLAGNAAKKQRFIPPAILNSKFESELMPLKKTLVAQPHPDADSSLVRTESSRTLNSPSGLTNVSHLDGNSAGYCKEEGKGIDSGSFVDDELKITKNPEITGKFLIKNTFNSPTIQSSILERHNMEAPVPKFFRVVWCKASRKKHKKWEGDGVLITKGRSAILKDLEGKDIGRGTGYKSAILESLTESHTLMVGGKEVEVMGVILPEDFKSGRCFLTVPTETSVLPDENVHQVIHKPFSNPLKNLSKEICQPQKTRDIGCKPRHSPDSPGALVMPRPNLNHQLQYNKLGLPVVDVVVDPYLSSHLRQHQRDGIIFLYECMLGMRVSGRFGAILADEMGLGKTLQCISLIWTLLRQGPYGAKPVIKRVLIVTPGSLVKNWSREFQKWLGKERINVFAVDQDHKIEEFISSPLYPILLISYEMMLRCLEQIMTVSFSLIICDEGHRLKNSNIKTSYALTSMPCERRIILTGTPVQNDLQEFYAIIEFVNPGILGSSSTYRKIYEEPILKSRQPSATTEERSLGNERASELVRITGFFTLRRTQEIINSYLPPKVEWVLFCQPSPLQLEVYRALLASHTVRSLLQGVLENSPHFVCIGALKKLCNHPALLYTTIKEKEAYPNLDCESTLYEGLSDLFPEEYMNGGYKTIDSGKLHVLLDLLLAIRDLSPTERVVLVSNYTQTLDMLENICKEFGYNYSRLDGQTPVSQRQQIVENFNSKYTTDFVFLLSSKAGGVGLNLVGASHLILYDIDWNPANDIQAMARVWRDGQKNTVHIYRFLTTGTIEEKMYQRQVSKQGLSGTVVDMTKKTDHTTFSAEDLQNLFMLHCDSECITHDLLNCKCESGENSKASSTVVKPVIQRRCQLGWDSESSQKLLSMSELMQWKHFSGTTASFTDPFVERVRKQITFAFQNKTEPKMFMDQ
ncbi:DNA repair and recombination protein RAD54B isoform X2 [Polypterus senegalus]